MHLMPNIPPAAALTALAAGSAFACPHHGPRATGLDSRSVLSSVPQRVSNARAAALVAWKPRAWTLVAPSQAHRRRRAAQDAPPQTTPIATEMARCDPLFRHVCAAAASTGLDRPVIGRVAHR